MASIITYKGVVYPEVTNPLFGEILWIERQFGKDSGLFTSLETVLSTALIAIRRVNPKVLKFEELDGLSFEDLQVTKVPEPEPDEQDEQDEPELDPTGAVVQTDQPSEPGQQGPRSES